MIRLLDDYIFDEQLRYEAHRLVYTPAGGEEYIFSGMVAAAVLGALLAVTDEGERRGIVPDTPEGRKDFFVRYEREVLADNGGLFATEVQALSEAYMEVSGETNVLARICRNDRLFDLAFGLVIEYMNRLAQEVACDHIYDLCPWSAPFAQWLFNAGFIETRRQRLLSVDWTDMAEVYTLAEELSKLQSSGSDLPSSPLFVFDGLSAEQVLNGYWNWLWTTVQEEAALYPDANVKLAEYKAKILANETDYDFLKPEMKDFTPDQINLFRKWMNLWTDFVKEKIAPAATHRQKNEEQLFFPDDILACPTEDQKEKYAATREYINERIKYDEKFRNFKKNESGAKLCRQLTLLFGWYVDPNSLRKCMKRKPKQKTKKYT